MTNDGGGGESNDEEDSTVGRREGSHVSAFVLGRKNEVGSERSDTKEEDERRLEEGTSPGDRKGLARQEERNE